MASPAQGLGRGDSAPESDFAPRGRFGRNVEMPRADVTTPAPPRSGSGPQGLLDRDTPESDEAPSLRSRGRRGREAAEPESPARGLRDRNRDRDDDPRRAGHGRPPSDDFPSARGAGGRPPSSPSNSNRGVGPRPPSGSNATQGMRPVKKTWRDWRPNQLVLRRNQVLTLGLVTALVILIAVAGVYRSVTAEETTFTADPATSKPAETKAALTTQSLDGRMGAYVGTDENLYQDFEKWWGRDLKYAVDFGSRDTWEQIANPSAVLNEWKDGKYRLVMAVPMLPTELLPAGQLVYEANSLPTKQREMANGAKGDYNQYFKELGERLVANNQEKAILRIGWEMNITTWMWSVDNPKSYKEFFKQIVKTMRAVPGNEFEFDWNVNNGFNPYNAEEYYPGDKFVDYVGIDVYDLHEGNYPYGKKCNQGCKETKQQKAWDENIFGGPQGLAYWTGFAADHDKPVSIPEWGLWDRYKDNTGGLDNPNFIRYMHDYLSRPQNNVAYANYFEYNSDQGEHSLRESFPNGAKVFKELFGPEKKAKKEEEK